MRPFTITWDADRLAWLREKLRAYRMPRLPEGAGWRYGCDPDVLADLCAYWCDGFDHDKAAAELNRFPQGMARIEDTEIHVVHVVGEAGGRRPLLLTHGWPGSVYEFWEVIEPLAFPSRHGGRAEDAFDIVVPALPGFGFSGKPKAPIGPRTTARLFDRLMREELGYPRYRAQGGDWGAGVTAWLALDHADSLEAIHLNYLLVQPDAEPESGPETVWRREALAAQRRLGAYADLQGTKPLSLAYAMADEPAAQLAWLVERFHDWADLRERPFAEVFPKDRLLTNALFYILTGAFETATWYYAGAQAEGVRRMPEGARVTVPTAFAAYPDPRTAPPPREWVERGYAVSRWRDMPRGGHFAAMEVPDLFVADLREWARE
ncbi:epoxide hydrolase family protein [Methylobacterium sp. J-076]|uniref:epoxide hydrolase family protein n=1 Tax=Methylobacterium sp. J-076 TaxID=2836655 RepID=UPI001FBB9BF0|nr:epoxide hydrolase family protein [Methylobacterium sp. J-076]MCJ2014695.1 epoxide hydrolase [Methylobacterium sp. J-076]